MKDNNEQWIDTVLSSMDKSQRAQPPRALWARIKHEVQEKPPVIIPMRTLRMIAAAAVILLMANAVAIVTSSSSSSASQSVTSSEYELVTDYNIYN